LIDIIYLNSSINYKFISYYSSLSFYWTYIGYFIVHA
jgi:hypothetical protein